MKSAIDWGLWGLYGFFPIPHFPRPHWCHRSPVPLVAPDPRGAAVASLSTDLSPSSVVVRSVVVRCGAPGATKPGAANNVAPQPAATIMERRDIVGGGCTESKLLSQIWMVSVRVIFDILVGEKNDWT